MIQRYTPFIWPNFVVFSFSFLHWLFLSLFCLSFNSFCPLGEAEPNYTLVFQLFTLRGIHTCPPFCIYCILHTGKQIKGGGRYPWAHLLQSVTCALVCCKCPCALNCEASPMTLLSDQWPLTHVKPIQPKSYAISFNPIPTHVSFQGQRIT